MQSFSRKLTKSKPFRAPGGSQGSNLPVYPTQETPSKSKDDVRRTNRNRISKSKAEVVVAIMGLTGAGKSSFIQTVTGNRDVGIGHGLNSGMFLLMILPNYILCFNSDD
jgi:ribosome biogenesis GTPase A